MLTSSHAYWTWRAARGRPGAAAAVAGGALPDVPALVAAAALRAGGVPRRDLLAAAYRRPLPRLVHLAAHSALAPAALAAAAGPRRPGARRLAAGWAGHLAADYATHHTDAWPPLWPLTRRVWRAPVSYWEPAHHARAWSAAEAVALLAAAATERSAPGRAAALAAAALATGPLRAGAARSVWEARGLQPGPPVVTPRRRRPTRRRGGRAGSIRGRRRS